MTGTATKVGGFALALAATFAAALGIGNVVGPVETPVAETEHSMEVDGAGSGHGTSGGAVESEHGAHGSSDEVTPAAMGGLMVSERGYTLALTEPSVLPDADVPITFGILGPDGNPVTDYDVVHDQRLHLIAVRRDLAGFQHVHPELTEAGTWTVPLSLTAGTWRVFADFRPTGEDLGLTLGADLFVPGNSQPVPLPPAGPTAEVDGYNVTLEGDLVAGEESELVLTVARNGESVTDLEPYLAAYGHLVALRVGDLAYLHVHPVGEPGDGVTEPGPTITFGATAPSAGPYRLFLDFQHDGVVRTAAFTVHSSAHHDQEPTP